MSAERTSANSAVAGLLLLAALLAKSTLRFGVPVAWDGVTLISQECGTDYDSNYLWRQTGDRPKITVYEKARP